MSLLALDPRLERLIARDRRDSARHALLVPVVTLPVGAWDLSDLTRAHPGNVGLLVVDGVLARDVFIGDNCTSTELLGPGDLVRPWHLNTEEPLLGQQVRWSALGEAALAVLDRRIALQLGRFPEIAVALVDRVDQRADRLAALKAITQLTPIDARLLALFWLLAEHWGRQAEDGVHVPLALSHRLLGNLVGARRPTVSTALGRLAAARELVRRSDGTWLITGRRAGRPAAEVSRFVAPRRRFVRASDA